MKRARSVIEDEECVDQLWVQSFNDECIEYISASLLRVKHCLEFHPGKCCFNCEGKCSVSKVKFTILCDFEIPATSTEPVFDLGTIRLSKTLWKRLKYYQMQFAEKVRANVRDLLLKDEFFEKVVLVKQKYAFPGCIPIRFELVKREK